MPTEAVKRKHIMFRSHSSLKKDVRSPHPHCTMLRTSPFALLARAWDLRACKNLCVLKWAFSSLLFTTGCFSNSDTEVSIGEMASTRPQQVKERKRTHP